MLLRRLLVTAVLINPPCAIDPDVEYPELKPMMELEPSERVFLTKIL